MIHFYLYRIVNFLFALFLPVKKNRILFLSFYGKSYSDNPKAISERLYSLYGEKYEYIWILNAKADYTYVPCYVRTCKYMSWKMLFYFATSKVWISNFCLPKGTYKKKEQYYIQTWHGDRALKKILLDVPEKTTYLFETKGMNLYIAGSDFMEKICRSAFGYKGEILSIGCPRNDIFFNSDNSKFDISIRLRYNIEATDKILVYAPTFRNMYKNKKQEVSLDLSTICRILVETTGRKWKILVRSHASNTKCGFDLAYSDSIISVTDYPDMNEILSISDILITDYSSSIGDFALKGLLCILYQDDVEEYKKGDRNFYFNMEDSPFYRFSTPNDLYTFLQNLDTVAAKSNSAAICNFYGVKETGRSSEIIAKRIDSVCGFTNK